MYHVAVSTMLTVIRMLLCLLSCSSGLHLLACDCLPVGTSLPAVMVASPVSLHSTHAVMHTVNPVCAYLNNSVSHHKIYGIPNCSRKPSLLNPLLTDQCISIGTVSVSPLACRSSIISAVMAITCSCTLHYNSPMSTVKGTAYLHHDSHASNAYCRNSRTAPLHSQCHELQPSLYMWSYNNTGNTTEQPKTLNIDVRNIGPTDQTHQHHELKRLRSVPCCVLSVDSCCCALSVSDSLLTSTVLGNDEYSMGPVNSSVMCFDAVHACAMLLFHSDHAGLLWFVQRHDIDCFPVLEQRFLTLGRAIGVAW
jgi:hypothetical protein